MKNDAEYVIGFPLDLWINSSTGEFLKKNKKEQEQSKQLLKKKLFDYIRLSLWVDFNSHYCIKNIAKDTYRFINETEDVIEIEFSNRIKRAKKRIRKGIGKDYKWRRKEGGVETEFENQPIKLSKKETSFIFCYTILGEFVASPKKNMIGRIILYPRAIAEASLEMGIDFDIIFWATLAHEAFHAFHCCLFKVSGCYNRWKDYSRKKECRIVLESLAARYEYVFLYKHINKSVYSIKKWIDAREDQWCDFDVNDWPYSGALGLGELRDKYDDNKNIIDEYMTRLLLELSIYDWKSPADIIQNGYYLPDNWRIFSPRNLLYM